MNNTTKLQQALMNGLAVPESALNESLAYQSIPEWDSMAHMFLVSELENAFGISIATEDILAMMDIKSIQETLERYNILFEAQISQ